MNQISKAFTEHPATVGETYFQHFNHSMSFAVRMLGGGLACMAHAFFPFLCVRTGSSQINKLHDKMVVNRNSQTPCSEKIRNVHTFIPEYYIQVATRPEVGVRTFAQQEYFQKYI